MTRFNRCPNPHCERACESGAFMVVYECKERKCGARYCYRCGGSTCPECGSRQRKEAGQVWRRL